MTSSVFWVIVFVLLVLLIGYLCYRVARAMSRVVRAAYRMGRMAGQPSGAVTQSAYEQAKPTGAPSAADDAGVLRTERALARMRRRAVLDLVLSVLMVLGFAVGWLVAHLPGWFVVLGILLVMQALAYAGLAYRTGLDLDAWRRNWLQVTVACAVWSAAGTLVDAQISV